MKIGQSGERALVLEDRPWFNGFIFYGIGVACIVGLAASAKTGLTMRETLIGALAAGWPTLLGILLLRHDRLIFDREKRQLTRERRSIWRKTTEIYELDRVVGARVEETPDGLDTLFQMEVQLANPSETLPFTSYRVFGSQPKLLAQNINEWLAQGNVDNR